MSLLVVTPESLASVTANLESIGSAVDAAHAAAAGPTTELMAAGADEVSAAVTAVFAKCGQEFQAFGAQASAFNRQFVQTLSAASNSYLAAEALNASTLQTAQTDALAVINAPSEALLGRPLIGNLASVPAASPAANIATLIMGGTGNPVPNSAYLTNIYNTYIARLIAPQTAIPTGLTTPEQGFPLTGLNSMTFDQSVAQGLASLQQAIAAQPPGTQTVVFGFSQSATIITDYFKGIANGSIQNAPLPTALKFILAGDPNNPDGGMFERFVGLYLPGFNETLNGATPNLAYPTSIYTIQYDGFADFPRYPLNFLADANAVAGLYYDHLSPIPAYESLTPRQIASAIPLPVSPGATGNSTYYFIPSQNLPLLQPLNLPQPLLNLIQPDLRVLIDMGYGNFGGPNTDYADLPTPASLFELANPVTVGTDLIKGAVQGVRADLVLAGVLPQADMPDTYPFVPSLDPNLSISLGQPSVTGLSAVTTGIGSLLRALNIPPFGI